MINSISSTPHVNNSTEFKGLPGRLNNPEHPNNGSGIKSMSEKAVTQAEQTTTSGQTPNSQQDGQNRKELLDNINKINYILGSQSYLQFEIDDGTDIIKIVDTQTKETLKQFPSEEMVAFQKHISELLDKETKEFAGLLLDEKV